LFFTYAGVRNTHPLVSDPLLAANMLIRLLRGREKKFVVGVERHSNPADPQRAMHLHVVIASDRAVDVADENYFDLRMTGWNTLKAHYDRIGATLRDLHKVIHYCMKDGDYVVCPEWAVVPKPVDVQGRSLAEALNMAETREEAADILQIEFPRDYYMNGTRVLPMIDARFGDFVTPKYSLEQFVRQALNLKENKVIVLYGKSGAGKTEFALAHFERPLLVSEMDDLKGLTARNDGIVFDDMEFTTLSAKAVIKLLDTSYKRSIQARYRNAVIPAGLPRIFTTNLHMVYPHSHIFPPGKNSEQYEAITRRYTAVRVDGNLFRDTPQAETNES